MKAGSRFHFAVAVAVVVETAPFVLFIKSGGGGAEILLFERGNRASYKISRRNLLFIGRWGRTLFGTFSRRKKYTPGQGSFASGAKAWLPHSSPIHTIRLGLTAGDAALAKRRPNNPK